MCRGIFKASTNDMLSFMDSGGLNLREENDISIVESFHLYVF